jgi:hypothetical protein
VKDKIKSLREAVGVEKISVEHEQGFDASKNA